MFHFWYSLQLRVICTVLIDTIWWFFSVLKSYDEHSLSANFLERNYTSVLIEFHFDASLNRSPAYAKHFSTLCCSAKGSEKAAEEETAHKLMSRTKNTYKFRTNSTASPPQARNSLKALALNEKKKEKKNLWKIINKQFIFHLIYLISLLSYSWKCFHEIVNNFSTECLVSFIHYSRLFNLFLLRLPLTLAPSLAYFWLFFFVSFTLLKASFS